MLRYWNGAADNHSVEAMKTARFLAALPWLAASDVCRAVGFTIYGKRF